MRRRVSKKQDSKRLSNRTILLCYVILLIVIATMMVMIVALNLIQSYNLKHTKIISPSIAVVSNDILLSDLKDRGIDVESIKSESDNSISVKIMDGPQVLFSTDQDAKQQVEVLAAILSRLSLENKQPSLVDLQYSKPIVKF